MVADKILVTGAGGQLGKTIVDALLDIYDESQVIVSDVRPVASHLTSQVLDVTDIQSVASVINDHKVNVVYHLAAILSAKGESNPDLTRKVNTDGYLNVLKVAASAGVRQIFFPSTIAVYGIGSNKEIAGQFDALIPTTAYGVSKVAGELWSQYYYERYGLDVRSLRFPGVIGHETMPGGGTTDYAIDIFHAALKDGSYECYLESDTRLPMIYMPDAVRAVMELMHVPAKKIGIHTSYNLAGFSFTPKELALAIKREIPAFRFNTKPDHRQEIAAHWPENIDDTYAREDWGWKPHFDLETMTRDMITNLPKRTK